MRIDPVPPGLDDELTSLLAVALLPAALHPGPWWDLSTRRAGVTIGHDAPSVVRSVESAGVGELSIAHRRIRAHRGGVVLDAGRRISSARGWSLAERACAVIDAHRSGLIDEHELRRELSRVRDEVRVEFESWEDYGRSWVLGAVLASSMGEGEPGWRGADRALVSLDAYCEAFEPGRPWSSVRWR